MILLLPLIYLIVCYCTETFAVQMEYVFYFLIIGFVYDICAGLLGDKE